MYACWLEHCIIIWLCTSSLKKTTHSRVAILIAVELLKAILAFLCHIHKVPLILRCTAIGGHLLLLFGMLTTYNTIIIISRKLAHVLFQDLKDLVLSFLWQLFTFRTITNLFNYLFSEINQGITTTPLKFLVIWEPSLVFSEEYVTIYGCDVNEIKKQILPPFPGLL